MAVFSRLGTLHKVGHEAPTPLIPPVPEATTFLDAGPLRFGVELRTLGEGDMPSAFSGPTVHVYGAEDGEEYLRFDVFDGLPHYHYIDPHAAFAPDQTVPGESDIVVVFDYAAHGPMWPWTVECLRSRLGAMLHEGGIHELADEVDDDAIAAVLPTIVELCEPTAPTEHWSRPATDPDKLPYYTHHVK